MRANNNKGRDQRRFSMPAVSRHQILKFSDYECDEEESQYSLSEFSQIHLADQDSHHQHHLTNGTAGHVGPTNFAGTHNQHHFQGFVNNHSGLLNSSASVSNNNTSNRKRALSFNNGTNTGTANSPSAASNSSDKRAATKVCRVCGDKAYSYNFNVITCESCKAFFRRNANKEKEIRCPFNEQCDINIVSRRFCQRCRLQKCFRVGMKKEWIMSEEARLEKKQRIQDNRERRMAERQAEAVLKS
uniref:Nuclear receptor domain-containing protein n=1 Tax=Ditylenchus dipsaci TaxID=166011 RepID=A0A915DTR1_9BILA